MLYRRSFLRMTALNPPLLFRQYVILALVAGACAVRAPWLGLTLLVMLAFLPGTLRMGGRGMLGAAFLAGLLLVQAALPEVPDKPSWASVPRKPLLVEGWVDTATGLPGGRVRVLLREVRQAREVPESAADEADRIRTRLLAPVRGAISGGVKDYAGALFHDNGAPLPGLVSLTLDARTLETTGRPVPGQKMTALLRLYPSGGSGNAHANGAGAYWAAREVWHNARLVWHERRPLFITLDEGSGWRFRVAALRERWRNSLMEALTEVGEADAKGRQMPAVRSVSGGFAREPENLSFSQGRAMLPALLFGDRSGLSTRTVDVFTRAGLIHSLALSGQHLALAAMAGVAAILILSQVRRDLYLTRPRRVLMAWAGLPFAFFYLFLGDAPFSLIRAALMMTAGVFYLTLRRPSAPLDALFAAAFLLFLAWPAAVFDLSVQLSVLAVAGILLVMPLVRIFRQALRPSGKASFLHRLFLHLLREIGTMLMISCSAQLAVLPVLVSVFGAVGPCFWLNVIWLPPLTFITLPCAALGLFLLVLSGPQAISALLFSLAAWPADLMLSFLELLDAAGALPFLQCIRPSSLSALGYGTAFVAAMLMLGVWLARKWRTGGRILRRWLCCGLILMLAGQFPQCLDEIQASFERRVTLSLIDVGHGQAVLLEYPGGRLLVDGGGSLSPFFDCGRSIVAPFLTDRQFPELDAVMVSHTDSDHARGLRWITEHFSVGALYWSPVSADRADAGEGLALREITRRNGIPERIVRQGDVLELGHDLKLEVLAPDIPEGEFVPDEKELSSNNGSLVLRLAYKDQGLVLLCGDMLAAGLRRLTKSGQALNAEVLVLPHHGAASSFQPCFYDAVQPELALASAAAYNHYDFPSHKVREEMARRKIPVFSTSTHGTFSLRWILKDGRYSLEQKEDFMVP